MAVSENRMVDALRGQAVSTSMDGSAGHRVMPNTESVKARYDRYGYIAPLPLFTATECRELLASLTRNPGPRPADWYKGWAPASPEYCAVAMHERILEWVVALLGKDVMLWGARLLDRRSGHVHCWHTDIETSDPLARALSVWIGLANTTERSSLKVVPESHRFRITPQQIMHQERRPREQVLDEDVARWARERDAAGGVVALSTTDGEAVMFDGRLWHASHNQSADTRQALLLQYATPETPIRIPNPTRVTWPFEFYETPTPPCILASGHSSGELNRIVPLPVAPSTDSLPTLTSCVRSLQLPLERDLVVKWKAHQLFHGSTAGLADMRCHASVLEAGHRPHPPHEHEHDEILIVLDGTADLALQTSAGSAVTAPHRVQRGAVAYYPAGFFHSISNPSDAPVTYLMFKWKNGQRTKDGVLPHHLISAFSTLQTLSAAASNGVGTTQWIDGKTESLRKLHVHTTVIAPGHGYAKRWSAYDGATVLIDGELETSVQRVKAPGVIYHAAGEPHAIQNVGSAPAICIGFEFHGTVARAVPSVS